jgi:hypothetical protein
MTAVRRGANGDFAWAWTMICSPVTRQSRSDTLDVGIYVQVLDAARAGRRVPLKATVYDACC